MHLLLLYISLSAAILISPFGSCLKKETLGDSSEDAQAKLYELTQQYIAEAQVV